MTTAKAKREAEEAKAEEAEVKAEAKAEAKAAKKLPWHIRTEAETAKAEDRQTEDQIADYHKTHPTLKPSGPEDEDD